MRKFHRFPAAAILATAAVLLAAGPQPAPSQEVELIAVDVKTVAKGYRTSQLTGEDVVNDRNEEIGEIDDFIVGRGDEHAVFAVLEVGGFLGLGGHLVAVPFQSLQLDGPGGRIVLPGATKEALENLPAFEYAG